MIWANFFHIYQPPHWPNRIIHKVARESYRPLVSILKKNKQIKITLNISGALTEQLAQHGFDDILRDIKKLSLKKQIELVGSAKYHPILPLLPTQEIIRQIKQNEEINKKYFGSAWSPQGFFPPEMAFGVKLAKIVEKLGYRWMIIDEIAGRGTLGKIRLDHRYYFDQSRMQIVFRNRAISDYLSFRCQINKFAPFWKSIDADGRCHPALITAMDGENLGHHRHGLDKFWQQLVSQNNVTTVTISELLTKYRGSQHLFPRSSSWSSQERELRAHNPYALWHDPKNPLHQLQWQLTNKLISLVNKKSSHRDFQLARRRLDQELASDQYWWASAKPWWNLNIITKKTNELTETALLLEPKSGEMIKLASQLISLAQSWQNTKKFLKVANHYLATNKQDNVRYIGGKKITIN